mmetsp:Transcript_33151/g.83663  ORF Transcript_33151/g.83663 Transcript_33151/m.83663 type:complete len:231 (+) Transcript_33151:180-872(+)
MAVELLPIALGRFLEISPDDLSTRHSSLLRVTGSLTLCQYMTPWNPIVSGTAMSKVRICARNEVTMGMGLRGQHRTCPTRTFSRSSLSPLSASVTLSPALACLSLLPCRSTLLTTVSTSPGRNSSESPTLTPPASSFPATQRPSPWVRNTSPTTILMLWSTARTGGCSLSMSSTSVGPAYHFLRSSSFLSRRFSPLNPLTGTKDTSSERYPARLRKAPTSDLISSNLFWE